MLKLKSKILCIMIVIATLLTVQPTSFAYQFSESLDNAIFLCINKPFAFNHGQRVEIDKSNPEIKPLLVSGRTLVPLRFIAQRLGADISWDSKTSSVLLTLEDKNVKIPLGKKKVYINGNEMVIDVPGKLIKGRTFIPLRVVAEAFNKKVFYSSGIIIIDDAQDIALNITREIIDDFKLWFEKPEDHALNIEPQTPKDMSVKEIAGLEKSVVIIKTYDSNKQVMSQGSAFCIKEGLFVTNFHVIQWGDSFTITDSSGNNYEVEGIVKFNPFLDLAIVKTREKPDIQPLKIGSKTMIDKGDKIVTISSPHGLQNTISDGIVSGFRDIEINGEKDINLIQITAPITHGSSGGALINTKGYVVGITSVGFGDGNLNFAISVDHIKDWITELESIPWEEIDVLFAQDPDGDIPDDEEITSVILTALKAIEEEDLDTYMSTVHDDNPAAKQMKETFAAFFEEHDAKYKVLELNVTKKSTSAAQAELLYVLEARTEEYKITMKLSGRYLLLKSGSNWKICLSNEKVMERSIESLSD